MPLHHVRLSLLIMSAMFEHPDETQPAEIDLRLSEGRKSSLVQGPGR